MICAVIVLIAVFVTLSALDILTTIKVIESGKGREANPVMRFLIGKIGLKPALYSSKTAMLLLLIPTVCLLDPAMSIVLLAILDTGMVWVVSNNQRRCRT